MNVLLITFLHGLPPIIGALIGRVPGLWIGAGVAAVFAIVFGGDRYTYQDLMGVCAGVLAGFFVIAKINEIKRLKAQLQDNKQKRNQD